MAKVKPDAEQVLKALGYRFALDDDRSSLVDEVEVRRSAVASARSGGPDDENENDNEEQTS